MFANAQLQTIVLTSQIDVAQSFYGGVLGLSLRGRSDGALVYALADGVLRVAPVAELTPSEHTVAGFAVADVAAAVRYLAGHGVSVARFEPMPHDEDGIVATPDGARVAWFRDPDGNILSVVQPPDSEY